ncbi:hypothetical protein [Nocardia sp. NPDC057668]|uniref:DUF7373 family lipoprotein n=1 Tax=Nocardia sp. NPDC057668 TaxID=3346202 RepID=UPI00366D49D8
MTVALTAALAACSSETGGTAIPGEIDIRLLSVGKYGTDPLEYRDTYEHNAAYGRSLALGRLADSVVIGADVDPKFTNSFEPRAITQPALTQFLLVSAAKSILEANGMILGFMAASSTHPPTDGRTWDGSDIFSPFGIGKTNRPEATSFSIMVLQFPDEQRAKTAAEQVEQADFDIAADQNARVTIDGYPNAKAHWRPGVASMAATMASGQYFINVYAQQPNPDAAELQKLLQRIFTAQLALLNQSPPLSARDSLHQDYDPQSMLRRTLNESGYAIPDAESHITRLPRGWLHYAADQRTWKTLLDDNGVDRISTAAALLLRARDSEAAVTLWAAINEQLPKTVDPPANTRDVVCKENPQPERSNGVHPAWYDNGRFYCNIRYDRYVARVASSQLADAQQRAAAQYALLAKSQYL